MTEIEHYRNTDPEFARLWEELERAQERSNRERTQEAEDALAMASDAVRDALQRKRTESRE